MKRFYLGLFLVVFIILTFSYSILRLLANGSEDNFFNKNYRLKFDRSALMRNILQLHFDGDARSDYLLSNSTKITVEIDQMQNLSIPTNALNLLAEKIKTATGKEVEYLYSDDQIPFEENVSKTRIDEIVKKYQSIKVKNPYLYMLFLSSSLEEADTLGSTYNENAIILFDNELQNFTKDNPETYSNYIESTALHEFGHQLGLGHNEEPDCLMNAHAEKSSVARERPQDVIVDFCDYEKNLIQQQKSD